MSLIRVHLAGLASSHSVSKLCHMSHVLLLTHSHFDAVLGVPEDHLEVQIISRDGALLVVITVDDDIQDLSVLVWWNLDLEVQ